MISFFFAFLFLLFFCFSFIGKKNGFGKVIGRIIYVVLIIGFITIGIYGSFQPYAKEDVIEIELTGDELIFELDENFNILTKITTKSGMVYQVNCASFGKDAKISSKTPNKVRQIKKTPAWYQYFYGTKMWLNYFRYGEFGEEIFFELLDDSKETEENE